jgi:hypothetical protein
VKKWVFTFLRALWAFFSTLFEARDPVSSTSEEGTTILKGWKNCPEQLILEAFNSERKFVKYQRPLLWMFCFKGPHMGEVISIKNRLELLGPSVRHTVIITPKNMANNSSYQIQIDNGITVTTKQGANFIINGKEETQASLIDFDIFEIFGNDFLIFENIAY